MTVYESLMFSKANAKVYGQDLKQMGMATMKQLEELPKHLPKGGKLLDLGCGAGQVTKWVAERLQSEAVGIDIDDEALLYAISHNDNAKIEYRKMDFMSIDLKDHEFSIILSIDTLYFCRSIENINSILAKCMELLKDDGVIAVFWENCPIPTFENNTNTAQGTPIGKWAEQNAYPYTALDFSNEMLDFWKSWSYFEESKEAILGEIDNQRYQQMEEEFNFMINHLTENPHCIGRWLYLIHKH